MMFRSGFWVLVTLILSACSLFGSMEDCEAVGIRWAPPSFAEVLDERCVAGVGPGNAQYRARYRINPGDLEAFQRATGYTDWQTAMPASTTFDDELASMSSFLFTGGGNGAYLWNVLIDTSASDAYTIHYFYAFID